MKTIGTTGRVVDCRKGVQHATTHIYGNAAVSKESIGEK
jgi:hypothetical protein